ncbi:reverse transcriptase domain-containing protein [Tanacetum coccineum]
MIALNEVKEIMTDISARHRQDSEEFYTCYQDAQDDRAVLQARISTLARERRYYRHMDIVADREAIQSMADALAEYEVNRNSGNRNGNGNDNGSHDSWGGGGRTPHTARLALLFEKIESVFHISKCTVECQVKFATCTLLGGALTWWNSYVRTVGHDAAYALPWKTLMKMMTENYYPRSEIKKLETELWNLVVKEAIELARSLMDQKLLTYAARQSENKRRLDNNSRNNNAQQPPNKRQNVARTYTAGSGEKREYDGTLPLCNKFKFHHNGSCAAKCTNCKRVGHLAHDCRSPTDVNTQRAPGTVQKNVRVLNVEVKGTSRGIARN